jgi:hypothetical protein
VVETDSTQDDLPQSPDTPHQEEKWVPLLLEELEKGDKKFLQSIISHKLPIKY